MSFMCHTISCCSFPAIQLDTAEKESLSADLLAFKRNAKCPLKLSLTWTIDHRHLDNLSEDLSMPMSWHCQPCQWHAPWWWKDNRGLPVVWWQNENTKGTFSSLRHSRRDRAAREWTAKLLITNTTPVSLQPLASGYCNNTVNNSIGSLLALVLL